MNGIPVARLFGFEIRLHPSWVVILAVITVLVAGQMDATTPEAPVPVRWIIGAVIAGAFLVSVLAHELGHGIAGRRRGVEVGPITLYFFGGSASFQVEADRPRDEIVVALAGPAVSLAIGFGLAVFGIAGSATHVPVIEVAAGVALVLAALNLILGGINLVPAYPLDGGRVVRAVVWARTGDERRGARAAAVSGRTVSWMIIGFGVVVAVAGRDMVDGLMVALSGWLLASASRGIERRVAVQDLLKDVRVGDVMDRTVSSIPPNLTVDTFGDRLLGNDESSALPVVHDDVIVGVVSASQVRKLRRGAWPTTRAEDLMVAPPALPLMRVSDTLWSALDGLRRTGLDGLPVVEGAGLLGVITRRGILAAIQKQAGIRGVSLR
jgi:Zn-dependent protease/predicted transcriptional regulator